MELVVIGGGCYGCYHARQLRKAIQRGRLACTRLLIIDHNPDCQARREFAGDPLVEVVRSDWLPFLKSYLTPAAVQHEARLVPTPFAPHLLFQWLLWNLQQHFPSLAVSQQPWEHRLGLPYEHPAQSSDYLISEAGWTCPATCIEPKVCPAIRDERAWDLHARVEALGPGVGVDGGEVFFCRHLAFGIGAIPVQEILASRERIVAAVASGMPRRFAIATTSRCHGVLSLLSLSPVLAVQHLRGSHVSVQEGRP